MDVVEITQTGATLRPMTADELVQREADNAEATVREQALQEAEAKRQAALAKLSALGLTRDDLTALGL